MYLKNSHASLDLPTPASPTTERSRALPSSVVAWRNSLSRRSSRSRPTNGGSSPVGRSDPPAPAMTRAARHSRTGSGLPFSWWVPASTYSIAASLALRVLSPTSTVPGSATDCTRLAVLTRSPATSPSALGSRLTAASPVSTPARRAGRARRPLTERRHGVHQLERRADGALGVVLLDRLDTPRCHHRVADELLDGAAVSGDHCRAVSKYPPNSSRTSSASRCCERDVNPTRSANSTDTWRRSAACAGARAAGTARGRGTGRGGATARPRRTRRRTRRPPGWRRRRPRT